MRVAGDDRLWRKRELSEAVDKLAPRSANRQDAKEEKFSAARWGRKK
jgi:hypothetical protein